MRNLLLILLLSPLLFLSCKNQQKRIKEVSRIPTAKDIIQQSIKYHDPNNNWASFKSDIHFKTQYWNKDGGIDLSSSSISFDNKKKIFTSKSTRNGIEILGYIDTDTCYKKANKKLDNETIEALKKSLTCESVTFSRDYYSYLIGMPMKLNDPGTIVNDTIFEREYDGILYNVAKVTYEPLDKNPVWYFYFDMKDHSFQLCKFTSREDENKGGEYIIYNDEFTSKQGIQLKNQQVWLYNTATLDTLAVDDLEFR